MSTSTYSNLLTEIQYLMGNRTDIQAQIPGYVSRAESEIYTSMRVNPMEATYSQTLTSTVQTFSLSVLTGFVALKTLRIPNQTGIIQLYKDSEWIYENYAQGVVANALPQWFGYDANSLVFGPTPDQDYPFAGTYYKRLDGLSLTNQTNWLTDYFGELILYGSLMKGFEATRDNATMLSDYRALFSEQVKRCKKYYEAQQTGGSVTVGTCR